MAFVHNWTGWKMSQDDKVAGLYPRELLAKLSLPVGQKHQQFGMVTIAFLYSYKSALWKREQKTQVVKKVLRSLKAIHGSNFRTLVDIILLQHKCGMSQKKQ